MLKALDNLKIHCDNLGRDYAEIEKTSLCTVNLSVKDTVDSIIKRVRELSEMGFSHAIFNMPDVYKMTSLETFTKEIIPEVAEL